jgi:hypothetical protein
MTASPLVRPQGAPSSGVEYRRFSGDRLAIVTQVDTACFPATWGPTKLLRELVAEHVPLGNGWRGELTVTGYRTPPLDDGTGTVYVSVAWKPHYKGEKVPT